MGSNFKNIKNDHLLRNFPKHKISHNSIINGLIKNNKIEEGLKYIDEIRKMNISLDLKTYNSIIYNNVSILL